jgi:glycerate 2-kinase
MPMEDISKKHAPKVLIAPTSFKESLTADHAARAMEEGVRERLPGAHCRRVPLADGGEGTLRILLGDNRTMHRTTVMGPMGVPLEAEWGFLAGTKTAIIESAQAIGLPLVSQQNRDPWRASSRGLGELMIEALEHGATQIRIGLGGVATVDGGVGMWQALGGAVTDASGQQVSTGARGLCQAAKIDLEPIGAKIGECQIEVLVDVDVPLLGSMGAHMFMAQKGATENDAEEIEAGLSRLAELVKQNPSSSRQVETIGAGAAGGLGAALAHLGADIALGAEVISQHVELESHIEWADVVVTGEGSIDAQTVTGKALMPLVRMANQKERPIFALTAIRAPVREYMGDAEISSIITIASGPMNGLAMIQDAANLVRQASFEIAGVFPFLRQQRAETA